MDNGEYSEPRQVRSDGSVIWSIKLLEASGLATGENVRVSTERESGRIVIERLKEGGKP
jgi:hypothetical protein